MTGLRLSGWEKREFSSLSFSDTVRKPFSLPRRVRVCVCVFTSACQSLRSSSVLAARLSPPLVFVKVLNPILSSSFTSQRASSRRSQQHSGADREGGMKLLTPLWFNLSCLILRSTQTHADWGILKITAALSGMCTLRTRLKKYFSLVVSDVFVYIRGGSRSYRRLYLRSEKLKAHLLQTGDWPPKEKQERWLFEQMPQNNLCLHSSAWLSPLA